MELLSTRCPRWHLERLFGGQVTQSPVKFKGRVRSSLASAICFRKRSRELSRFKDFALFGGCDCSRQKSLRWSRNCGLSRCNSILNNPVASSSGSAGKRRGSLRWRWSRWPGWRRSLSSQARSRSWRSMARCTPCRCRRSRSRWRMESWKGMII